MRRRLLVGLGAADDFPAQPDALVADEDAGTGDDLVDLVLSLPAEAAVDLNRVLLVARHATLP
jgi:hypothetical protein